MPERRVTAGASDLRAYLAKNKLSITRFCDEHDIDRIQVQKLLNGDHWQRVSVNFAFSIQRATGGRVRAERFVATLARPLTGTDG